MSLESIAARLRQAGHVTVFTGAGASAESGIPTFRDALTGPWRTSDRRGVRRGSIPLLRMV